jgi:hypothetical protein
VNIYRFIKCAEAMRKGGLDSVEAPRSFGSIKARAHRHRKLEAAYGALWGFSIKHPDSTRTRKARLKAIARRMWNELEEKEI